MLLKYQTDHYDTLTGLYNNYLLFLSTPFERDLKMLYLGKLVG